jgi:hypothetical protein
MHILVCGIPGTGKSKFSRWLVSEHNYVRCPRKDEPSTDFSVEVDNALLANEDVVIDWGFPAFDPAFRGCLGFVRHLIEERNVEQWWFDGDRDAAFRSFRDRNAKEGRPPSQREWDRQLNGINSHWPEIFAVFSGRILNVIEGGPVYMPNEERLAAMLAYAASTR